MHRAALGAAWSGALLSFLLLAGCPNKTVVKKDESATADAGALAKADAGPPEASGPEPTPEPPAKVDNSQEVKERFKSAMSAAEKDPLQALKGLEQVLQTDPKNHKAWYNIGVLQDRLNNPTGSRMAYMNALRIKPDFVPAAMNLMRVYLRQNRSSEAMSLIVEKSREYPKELAFQNALIYLYIRQGQLSRAEQMARALRRKDEKNAQAILNLGLVWYKQEKYELARTALSLAADADKKMAEPHYYLGFTYKKLKDVSSAITHLEKAIKLRNAFPEAHNLLGVLLMERGKVRDAEPHFRTAVEFAPRMWEARLNFGIVLNATQKYKESLEAFLKLLQDNPSYVDAHYNIGILHLDRDLRIQRAMPVSRFMKEVPPDVQNEKRVARVVDGIARFATAAYHLQAYINQKRGLASDAPVHSYLADANKQLASFRKRLDSTIKSIRRQRLRKAKKAAKKKATKKP
ncbi:MAG: tetratricopeptide repeat protein [Myxococcales bacterium]|nr:tetratricopeptide repeat protein [Myxococcales bacterium]